MTQPTAEGNRGPQPRRDVESAGLADDDSRHTNAARALALGALLSGRRTAVAGIERDVAALGVPLDLGRPSTWDERTEALEESDELLTEVGAGDVVESELEPRRGLADRSIEP